MIEEKRKERALQSITKARRKLLANILAHFSWYTMIALVIGSLVLRGEEVINLPKLIVGVVLTLLWVLMAVAVEPGDGSFKEEENE
jgi:DMSO/TMAO reductase YedYZ heme-binding membrane subunit